MVKIAKMKKDVLRKRTYWFMFSEANLNKSYTFSHCPIMSVVKKNCFLSFLLFLSLLECSYGRFIFDYEDDDPMIVDTRRGKVKGLPTRASNGKRVDAFLGIPYAKPPIGELRFRHPKNIDSWKGAYKATELPNTCYQVPDSVFGDDFIGSKMWNPNTNLSEDCLYLNIWVPSPRPPPGSLSVLVWIYGGSYYSGSSTLEVYDGRTIASEEQVIVASMNYRVASLGFLHIGDRTDAPGNAGMFDQIMALQWIRDNIESFGGIGNNITLFGESAGASSCAMHMVSPISRNLFSRVILQV